MHLKNFSLITEDMSNIRLSPSYDLLSTRLLIPAQHDSEELALPLNGKKQNIRKKDFVEFGRNLNIPEKVIQNTIEDMYSNFSLWEQKIQQSFLNNKLKEQFCQLVKMRLQVFDT